MIMYKTASLFDAPKGAYLVHACNAQGVWGSGIAVEFKKRFPGAFAHYNRNCQNPSHMVLGHSWCMHETDYTVVCLMVSYGYGRTVSSKEEILARTRTSVVELLNATKEAAKFMKEPPMICSNKFNSGYFGVPWPETEAVLAECLKDYPYDWVVYDPA
jgi:ADP-ribose 1''-phosphate phosphatase